MKATRVDIEVFTSTICKNCQRASYMVEEVLKDPDFESITWREVDVLVEIDHAVALGVLATPAIVMGGTLAFTALPSKQQFRSAVQHYRNKQKDKP